MVDMALARLATDDSKRRAELQTLRAGVEEALKQRQRLVKKTFYHFGTLPVEIATIVFTFVIEEDHAGVVILAQVCQHWRNIVSATPAFWRTLVLSSRNSRRCAAKVKLWDSRSGGYIRTLRIEDSNPRTVDALATLSADTWQSLESLKLAESGVHILKTLSAARDAIPTLVSLELIGPMDAFYFRELQDLRLRRLIVDSTPIEWPSLADRCTELRELVYRGSFGDDGLPDLMWLLHRNDHLETLSLVFFGKPNVAFPSISRTLPEVIDLPHLSSITLGGSHLNPHRLLSSLSLSRLRSLRLQQVVGTLDITLQHLLHGTALTSLEQLEISHCAVANTGLIVRILHVATGLQSFQLNNTADVAYILETLAQAPKPAQSRDGTSPELLCPKLTAIDFSRCPDVRDGPLIRLVKARSAISASTPATNTPNSEVSQSPQVARLRSLVIDGCDNVDSSILPWIRQQIPHVSCQYATKRQASWKR